MLLTEDGLELKARSRLHSLGHMLEYFTLKTFCAVFCAKLFPANHCTVSDLILCLLHWIQGVGF